MDALLAEWKSHSESIIQTSQHAVQQNLNESLHGLMRLADQNNQRQFQQHHALIASVDQRVVTVEGGMQALQVMNQQLWGELEVVKKALAVAPQAAPALQVGEDERWEAQPDLGIVKGHCAQSVSLQAFANSVAPWLQRCQMQPGVDFDFSGDSSILQTEWNIIFCGLPGTAAKKAQSCLRRLKISAGNYEKFWIFTPTEEWIPLFVSGDKNNKQITTEMTTKRMRDCVAARYVKGPAEEITAARREGVVCIAQIPLCILMPKSCGDCCLQWNEPLLQRSELCKATLLADFSAASESALANSSGPRALRAKVGAIQWSP